MSNKLFEVFNLDTYANAQPSNLPNNPTEAEEITAWLTPQQWPLRPPSWPLHYLPVKNPKKRDDIGMPALGTLIFENGKYFFSDVGVYSPDLPKTTTGLAEANPVMMLEEGWVGD